MTSSVLCLIYKALVVPVAWQYDEPRDDVSDLGYLGSSTVQENNQIQLKFF